MLVLARRPKESIFISDNIKITVLTVNGNVVRIGIEAPKDIKIYREEIMKKAPPSWGEDQLEEIDQKAAEILSKMRPR